MGLYNALFGVNKYALILLKCLDLYAMHIRASLDVKGGYATGRFRDIFTSEDGSKIILYTRNGGGNRECYCESEEHESGCLQQIIKNLQSHPNYITDYDDDFDCTYAYFEFNIPEKYKKIVKLISELQGKPKNVSEQFDEVIKEMHNMTPEQIRTDPRFSEIAKMLEDILKKV